ncbi:MAG TPA: quinone-dependent dihydroorotate dehydrogenase [Bacilli bacterium]
MLYRKLVKPLLFRIDPEKIHNRTIAGLRLAANVPGVLPAMRAICGVQATRKLAVDVFGLHFHNPVGLAAGLDKNGAAIPAFSSFGFGFVEVGTVTPKPQPGNELPRLFRLPEDEALINRMGFNNAGAQALAEKMRALRIRPVPVAINIGKNKTTPNEQAVNDYRACIDTLYEYGDFFVVNISSPNTPDLRKLQYGDFLQTLLNAVVREMRRKAGDRPVKPALVKIAPDVAPDELQLMAETIAASGISGIIATNTTVARQGLKSGHAAETGGLSGKPLNKRSTEVIRALYRATNGKLPIIGSGGIFTAEDAYAKIRAGASLVEVYTALIYQGPGIVKKINAGLLKLMQQDGIHHISQAVGLDAMAE